MRIGINAIFLAPGKGGGMERYLANMVRAMDSLLPRGSLMAFSGREGLPGMEGVMPVITAPVSSHQRWARLLWEQACFPGVAKKHFPDVMISFGNVCPLALPCPSILVMHDLIPFMPRNGFSPLEKLAARTLFRASARAADRIVTVSSFSKQEISGTLGIPEHKIQVIHGACDPMFSSKTDTQRLPEKPYILAMCSALPHKNLTGLLRAFAILRDIGHRDLHLVITHTAGTDWEIRSRAKAMGLGDIVGATGPIPDTDLARLYQEAQVCVYPSLYEGFGLPLLEAMACGTPVIASNRAAIPEVAGDAALLVDAGNPEKLSKAIDQVLQDQALQASLIEKGKQRTSMFSWEKSAAQMIRAATALAGGSS